MDYNVVNIQKTSYDVSQDNQAKKNRVKNKSSKVNNDNDKIYLHIKFNIPVNGATITNKSVFITDEDGNKIHCLARYKSNDNMMIVTIKGQIVENKVYYLSLSKNIKSVGNNSLKKKTRFEFVIKNSKSGEFYATGGDGKTSTNFGVGRRVALANVDIIDKIDVKNLPYNQDKKLPIIRNYDSVLTGIFLIFVSSIAVVTGRSYIFVISGILLLTFIALVLKNVFSAKGRAIIEYNKGVRLFNSYDFKSSLEHFENSLSYNSKNELFQKALDIANIKSSSQSPHA